MLYHFLNLSIRSFNFLGYQYYLFFFTTSINGNKIYRCNVLYSHDDIIKWNHYPLYWPFVRGIHRSPVNSPHKGQWRGALMFSLLCAKINGSVNNREAGDLRRHQAHYDVTVMIWVCYNTFVAAKMWLWRLPRNDCHSRPFYTTRFYYNCPELSYCKMQ